MDSSPAGAPSRQPWPSLWIVALASLLAQLALCQFFTFGQGVPFTIDVNPSNVWKYAYQFPPAGEFLTLNWFGVANLPPTLNPFSLAAAILPPWLFFTAYAPLLATAALLAMTAFLRELDLPRPAALIGGVTYAWQGDLLPFVFPGHYGYITTWAFFALAGWAALRAPRSRAYALIAGASCGMMIGLQPDRGSIASLLIAALYLVPVLRALVREKPGSPLAPAQIRTIAQGALSLALCIGTAALVSFAAFLTLFQSYIVGVKLGGASNREQAFDLATQFSLGPAETFSYLVPGFFGWTNTHPTGPYWGWIGQSPGYDIAHQGARNLNLAISTTGTVAAILALLGVLLLLPGFLGRFFGNGGFTQRQLDFGRLLLVLGALSLALSWGYHTPLYRPLFALPLMDKWRNPLKWLEIFNFAAVVLAAFGAAQAMRSLADPAQRRALNLYLAVIDGLLFVFLLASYPLAIVIAGYLNAEQYQPGEIANVMHTLHVSLAFALVLGLLLWLFLLGAWRGDRLQGWEIVNPWLRRQWHRALAAENRPGTLAFCCAALIALQLGWVAAQFIAPTELARLTDTNPLLQSLRAEGPLVRVAVPQPQDSLLNFFLQNQFAELRISSVDISAASRIPDALTAFVGAFAGHTARLWTIGGVKNVAIGQHDLATLRQDAEVAANVAAADGYTLSPTPDDQPTHALVRLRDYFEKATFVPGGENFPGDDAMLKRLADPKWNPRATILYATSGPGAGKVFNFVGSIKTAVRETNAAGTVVATGQLIPSPGSTFPPSLPEPVEGSVPPPLPPHLLGLNPHIAPPPADATPVDVTRYTGHEIDLTLNAPSAGYVLVNDQYDPDWQVTVNGRPAPLLRADYLLRAVVVLPGPSTIALRYVAHYRLLGLSLPVVATNNFSDAAMLAAFIGGALLLRRRNPR